MPKQVIVQSSIEAVEIIDTPIPNPQDHEVVIRVVVAASNPKDWKIPLWKDLPHNSGDDLAGIVHSVGKDVYEFKPGDRVAALHQPGTDNGGYAEYSVAPDWTTFHIPQNVSFEEAATIPVCALTAAVALYIDLKIPAPYSMAKSAEGGAERVPILIYGVTSAVGAFAAKFARLSGLSPIIGIAGQSGHFAETLVDYVVDYRNGEDALVAAVEDVLVKEGLRSKLPIIFDAISENGSLEATLRLIDLNGGTISTLLPPTLFAKDTKTFRYPPGVKAINTVLPLAVHMAHKDFGCLWSRYIGRLLEDGRLKAHPYEVIPGGLNGVLTGLQKLKDGKASGIKYVYRVEDTKDNPMLEVSGVKKSGGQSSGSHSRQKNTHPMRNFPFPAED